MTSAEMTMPGSTTTSEAQDVPRPASPREGALRFWLRPLVQSLLVIALAAASYWFISRFLLQSVQVVGVSMHPTLHNSERYLLNRWIYCCRAPRRGDVVVIRDPADRGFSVKRIVALPGETIYLRNGAVVLNGKKIEEAFLPKGTPTYPDAKLREQSLKCGKDQFIVLGDNRMNSVDSRSYGPVAKSDILGMVVR